MYSVLHRQNFFLVKNYVHENEVGSTHHCVCKANEKIFMYYWKDIFYMRVSMSVLLAERNSFVAGVLYYFKIVCVVCNRVTDVYV